MGGPIDLIASLITHANEFAWGPMTPAMTQGMER